MTFTDSTRYSRSRHFWSLCSYGCISYLRYLVSEIFSVEKYRNLEIPVKSQSRSLKVVPFDRLEYGFTLVFCSNFILKRTVFEIFDLKYAVTLKTGWESVKVIEMSPFDRAPMTSCWRYIVTMALSHIVSEIFNVENIVILKSGSEVTQGHWKWYHWLDWVWCLLKIFFEKSFIHHRW